MSSASAKVDSRQAQPCAPPIPAWKGYDTINEAALPPRSSDRP